jgi:iron(III) transport system substrate-binding protein
MDQATRRLGLAVTIVAVCASACGVAAQAGEDDVVRVYSARHYDLEKAFNEFADQTGISVEFLFGGDAELRERIAAEGEDTPADLYMTVDAGNLALAAEQGLFQSVDSPKLREAVPASLRDPRGRWFGLSKRARTIVYNPDTVDPSQLSTYAALADKRWDGRLCMRRSTNVYTQSLVASLIANQGPDRAGEIVAGWVANDTRILNNDIQILESIAAGGCDVGITNHYYLARLLSDNPDFGVELFWANQDGRGTHVNVSGAGVTRHADDSELARRLLEWLATEGQESFVEGNYEYPVNDAVEPADLLQREFGEFQADPLNAGEYGSLNADAVELMAETGYE